ncbi:ribokinase [Jatrophihabitans fulvus]
MAAHARPPAVAVVGSLNLDIVVGVASLPGRGETVIATSTATGPGGKGANQAAAAAALSPHVAMIGRVGADEAGASLVRDLAGRGVDVAGVVATEGVPSGTATVAVEDGTGENLILVAPGANASLTTDDVRVPAVRSAAVVLLQLEVPMRTAIAAAAAASGTVVLNPAPMQELPGPLLERVDVLVPNEGELARLAGRDGFASDDEIADAARAVGVRGVVVTLGARGALVVPEDGPHRLVPPPSVTAVDTTGAGDCFCGALSVSLAQGASLADAAAYAVVAAALSTTAAGARGFLPDDAAVREAFVA